MHRQKFIQFRRRNWFCISLSPSGHIKNWNNQVFRTSKISARYRRPLPNLYRPAQIRLGRQRHIQAPKRRRRDRSNRSRRNPIHLRPFRHNRRQRKGANRRRETTSQDRSPAESCSTRRCDLPRSPSAVHAAVISSETHPWFILWLLPGHSWKNSE